MTIRTHNRKRWHGLFLAATLAAAGISRAIVPEPDAVIYGYLYHRFDQPLAASQSGELTLIAQVNGTNLATFVLSPGTNSFLLRIPMDDGLQPRLANTATAGDRVRFIVRNNQTQTQFECVQSYAQSWTLPVGRAPVVSMNLSVEGNVAGVAPDTNGDGIPDYWINHFHLAPSVAGASQDADRDGASNLQEFITGTDPSDAGSKFTVVLSRKASQAVSLSFGPAFTDRTYLVLVSDSPNGPWVEQQAIVPALSEPQTVDFPILPTGPARFFRVSIRFTR